MRNTEEDDDTSFPRAKLNEESVNDPLEMLNGVYPIVDEDAGCGWNRGSSSDSEFTGVTVTVFVSTATCCLSDVCVSL